LQGDAPKAGAGAGEVVKALAPEVMKRVEALSELQSKFSEQHAAYVEEYKALQRKYHDIHTDLYAKRSEIVNGKVDPAGAAGACPFHPLCPLWICAGLEDLNSDGFGGIPVRPRR
jgi:hypothetical protein